MRVSRLPLVRAALRALVLAFLLILLWHHTARADNTVVQPPCLEAQLDTALDIVHASGGGTMTFNCGTAIILLTSQKVLTGTVVIDGGGTVTLSGNNATRIFLAQVGSQVELRGLTLANGLASGGGALLNYGSVTIRNSTIRNSTANSPWAGGGIASHGSLVVDQSVIRDNQAIDAGGIYLAGTGVISNTTISGNRATSGRGGGLWLHGNAKIYEGLIENNVAVRTTTSTPYGGGIFVYQTGQLEMVGGVVRANDAYFGGGGIFIGGFAFLVGVTIEQNTSFRGGAGIDVSIATQGQIEKPTLDAYGITVAHNHTGRGDGGGISVSESSRATIENTILFSNTTVLEGGGLASYGTLVMRRSTVEANVGASGGGGLELNGPSTLENVTITGNTVTRDTGRGGGIDYFTAITLRNVTIAGNTAGGGGSALAHLVIDGTPPPIATLRNTVLVGKGTLTCYVQTGSIASQGFNADSDGSCKLTQVTDHPSINPMLTPAGNYGGFTRTHVPLPGSPLIDTGSCIDETKYDQRIVLRPQLGACDIGAVEVRNVRLSVVKTGQGTVAGGAISCGPTCSASIQEVTQLTLNAQPAEGHMFIGWGGACQGSGPCALTVVTTATVEAAFAPIPPDTFSLTVSRTGSGTVTSNPGGINCGGDCAHTYTDGTQVALTAAAAQGHHFVSWGGACSGAGACSVSMTQARTVSATFAPNTTPMNRTVFLPTVRR